MNLSQLKRILLQALLLPVVALLLVSGLLAWQIVSGQQTVAQIQTADDNIAAINRLAALIIDEETGVRGYQATSNEIFLQPYTLSEVPLQHDIAQLHAGIDRQHGNGAVLGSLSHAHERWRQTIGEPIIALVAAGKDTRDAALNLRGKAEMDDMHLLELDLIADQEQQRAALVEHRREQVRDTLGGILILSLVVGLLIGLFARSRLHRVSSAFQGALQALRANAQATYESEQRLRATLTSIGEGVVVCDNEGRVELLNTVAEQMTGRTQAESRHEPMERIFPLIDEATRRPLPTVPLAPPQASELAAVLPVSALLLGADGREICVESSGAPVYDQSGKVTGSVIVIRDVTGQRRTQAALLTSEKLAVAGRLAAAIAHEIHNPLDAVVNLLYLLQQGASGGAHTNTPEETAEFLTMAQAELTRVTHISRAMLGMYRESRTPVALDVSEILTSVLLLLEHQLLQAGVTVERELEPGAMATGYPAELRQVFTNLLANAGEASATGTILRVSVHSQDSPAGVQVRITDHGTGIESAALERIFQPFFTTKGEQGTGLGLWITQGIVEKHGGTIKVESSVEAEGHGTTFAVFLPQGDAKAGEAEQVLRS